MKMIKKGAIVLLLIVMMALLCGCNNSSDHPLAAQAINTKAYIKVNEKTIVVDIEAYMHGSNGVVTIYGVDGKTYKTHAINVVLIKDSEGQ